ncbi:MAG: hypothetical protein QXX30_02265 [Candidatus Aenigmatarchaeota archaeon]
MKKVKVRFRPRTSLRVAYKGMVYRLVTEGEEQFVELPMRNMGEKEAAELLEHLKKIGLLSSYETNVVEDTVAVQSKEEKSEELQQEDTPTSQVSTEENSTNEEVVKETVKEDKPEKETEDSSQKSETSQSTKKRRNRKTN